MGLVALIALLVTSALHDALFGEQLAASRMLHQRAAAHAELGLEEGLAWIAALEEPASGSFVSSLPADSTDAAGVQIRYLGTARLPAGFSWSQFAAHRFEIESTAHAARGIAATHLQGALRILPVAAAATEAADDGST